MSSEMFSPRLASSHLLSILSLDDGKDGEKRTATSACLVALRSCEAAPKELEVKLQPLAKPGLKSKWPSNRAQSGANLEKSQN